MQQKPNFKYKIMVSKHVIAGIQQQTVYLFNAGPYGLLKTIKIKDNYQITNRHADGSHRNSAMVVNLKCIARLGGYFLFLQLEQDSTTAMSLQ